jgi:hypothetical protein
MGGIGARRGIGVRVALAAVVLHRAEIGSTAGRRKRKWFGIDYYGLEKNKKQFSNIISDVWVIFHKLMLREYVKFGVGRDFEMN